MADSYGVVPNPLVLASGSPRRRALLERAGVQFEVCPADIPELQQPGEAPEAFARRLAAEKALAVARRLGTGEQRLVLGADTIVVLGGAVLGKPRDAEQAVEMLASLVGRSHVVTTGVAVARPSDGSVRDLAVHSRVRMRAASMDEIREYVATGESLDKAGAYALQGEGRRFVEAVEGSESNVIGLPLDETLELLRAGAAAERDE